MKIKDTYLVRSVAGENLVIPLTGSSISFNSTVTLNETGRFLWDLLQQETDFDTLLSALLKEYDVDTDTATRDIAAFIETLRENNILEDEEQTKKTNK